MGSYIVRCLLPLQANGWDGDTTSMTWGARTPENKSRAAQASDIVVFHRAAEPKKLELARLLKLQGKKIVYDSDDTWKDTKGVRLSDYINEERLKRGSEALNKYVDATIIEADLVTTSTEFLAAEYRQLNPNVVVLPNCIDPFYFEEPLRNEGEKIRIGVTGSVAATDDLKVLAPIIEHYEHDPRVTIVFFSLPANRYDKLVNAVYDKEYEFLDSVNVEWHPYVDADLYYDKLNSLRLDMMIIPRADNYFNRCKSNLKFLEASMFKIPVIAQSFPDGKSPYEVDPEDAENLMLAKDTQSWFDMIELLIRFKETRLKLGSKAYEYVKGKYDINLRGHLWREAYEKLI